MISKFHSDLKNLVTAEESYFSDASTYGVVADLTGANVWAPTTGVFAVVTLAANPATGFAATATHAGATGTTACGVFVGTGAPPGGITVEGEVSCW